MARAHAVNIRATPACEPHWGRDTFIRDKRFDHLHVLGGKLGAELVGTGIEACGVRFLRLRRRPLVEGQKSFAATLVQAEFARGSAELAHHGRVDLLAVRRRVARGLSLIHI
jgi:hypothetical protein